MSQGPGHNGPNYGAIPSGCELDHGSTTADNARGGFRVRWTDRFNKEHMIDLGGTAQVTVKFPIPHGGDWNWQDSWDMEHNEWDRTGFNPAVTWVEATFRKESDYVRIVSTGHRSIPADPGLWGEIQARITDVAAIAALGAKTAAEAETIAGAAGLLA